MLLMDICRVLSCLYFMFFMLYTVGQFTQWLYSDPYVALGKRNVPLEVHVPLVGKPFHIGKKFVTGNSKSFVSPCHILLFGCCARLQCSDRVEH